MSKGKNSGAATKKVAVPQSLEEALTLIEEVNKSIEELEANNAELTEKLETANEKIAELKTANDELTEKLEGLSESDEIIGELNQKIKDLEAKIDEYKTGVPVLPEITIEGKTYIINSAANGKTREQLAADTDACEKLLEIDGQTILTEKEG